ncbi:amino acid permease-domain-containing protein [Rhodocollybia butyracea]|uniref:Amino acid permease-domain-containing protein n=1 Tax=Rhodocollybia butyracea TaxID=206335 RepID=A0A9P5TVD2_9AGAR|nr:amino acid permease-domain-containing protein [Rhodocollybia butyracea]
MSHEALDNANTLHEKSYIPSSHDLVNETAPMEATTKRGLKTRHAQMIALGGSIGTGLFLGSGATLARGGPLFILTAIQSFPFWSSAYLPVSGGTMSYYGHRNVSSSLGFSMGWLYFYSLGIQVPYEITAAALVIDYWDSPVNIAVWITIFIVVIVGLNVLPVKYYGEAEFWFSSLKIFMMIGLLILTFILFWGGGPDQNGILGFRYWKDPGPANTWLVPGGTGRFVAFIEVVVLSAFPFTFAPELLIVTAGEMDSPRRNLPKAAKRYLFRLVFFYIGCVFSIGIICPSNDKNLTNGGVGAKSSPFVVGITNAGIKGLGSVINAVILTSAWSSGNSFLYMSSRSLYSLAVAGNAPKIFAKCTKKGVPYMAVGASSLFLLPCLSQLRQTAPPLYLLVCEPNQQLLDLSPGFAAASSITAFARLANWIAIVGFTILLLINGFGVFFPGRFNASSFFTAYVGIPIFLAIYFGHRVLHWKDPWAHHSSEVDLHSGIDLVLANEHPDSPSTKWKARLTAWFT